MEIQSLDTGKASYSNVGEKPLSGRLSGETLTGFVIEKFENQRQLVNVAFGPKNSWYMQWSDGTCAWENIPRSLHCKLNQRNKNLPSPLIVSMSTENQWIILYKDGTFATSEHLVDPYLVESLLDESEPNYFTFAPAGGWLLVRRDGSVAWDKLPSTLEELLLKRRPSDPSIKIVSISMFGGWFIRFDDGECEWEGIPNPLIKILIQNIRKGHENIVLSLSPCDGSSYFINMGNVTEWSVKNVNFENSISGNNTTLPKSVNWE